MTLDLEVIAKALLEGERFSVAGPDGPRGERGEQGPAGFDGVEGPPGEKGDKGDKGDPGEQGPPGRDGKDGEDGEDGEDGKKGDRGLRGEKGTTGDRGPQGKDGRIGPQGLRGPAGRGGNLGGGSSSGGGAPSGAAGGDLSGTYPNPSVVDDSHSHGAGTAPGAGGNIEQTLIAGDDAGGQEVLGLGQVTVNPGATQLYGLLIQALAGFDNNYNAFIRVYDEFGTEIFNIDAGGFDQKAPAGYLSTHVHLSNTDDFGSADLSTQYGLEVRDGTTGALITIGGYHGIQMSPFVPTNAPDTSRVQLYYDDTNGAAYLRIRGKTANATAVTGQVRLGATPQTYTESNVTTDRALNANATSIDELADVLGTLIGDLRAQGLVA